MRFLIAFLFITQVFWAAKPSYITNSWIQENGFYIGTEEIRARDADGLKLYDDGGSDGIFVEDGGLVGIGTTNPEYGNLHLESAGGLDTGLAVRSTGTNNRLFNLYVDDDEEAVIFNSRTNGGSPYPFSFKSANVGFGTTDPDGIFPGTNGIAVEDSVSGFPSYALSDGTKKYMMFLGASDQLSFYDINNTSERLVILSDGKVGIGDASPSQPLEVYLANNEYVKFRKFGTDDRFSFLNTAGGQAELYMYDASTTLKLKLDTNGLSYLLGGDFGIGTNANTNRLEVREDSTTDATILVRSLSNGDPAISFLTDEQQFTLGIDDSTHNLKLVSGGTASNTAIIAVTGTNVGIGAEDVSCLLSVGTNSSVTSGVDVKVNGGIEAAFYDVVSDENLKNEIAPIESALTRIVSLSPVTYKMKSKPEDFTEEQKRVYKKALGKKFKSIERQRIVTKTVEVPYKPEPKPVAKVAAIPEWLDGGEKPEGIEQEEVRPDTIGEIMVPVTTTVVETYYEQVEVEPTYDELAKAMNLRKQAGFTAQNVCLSIPEACSGTDDVKTYRLSAIVSVLVRSVQEQQAQIIELQNRVTALEKVPVLEK